MKKIKHSWTKSAPSKEGTLWTVCSRCGVILRADGKNENNMCLGYVRITLR